MTGEGGLLEVSLMVTREKCTDKLHVQSYFSLAQVLLVLFTNWGHCLFKGNSVLIIIIGPTLRSAIDSSHNQMAAYEGTNNQGMIEK